MSSLNSFRDHLRERRLFIGRLWQAVLLILLLLTGLVARMAYLQIEQHPYFAQMSTENRVRVQPLPPTRGLIYDRNGELLAQNIPVHSLVIIPERVKDMAWTLEQLAQLVTISEEDLTRFERLRQQRRRFENVLLRSALSESEVAIIAVNRHRFPGVDIEAKLLRSYPHGVETAHVVGYVGRISEQDLAEIDGSAYSGTSYIGKTGVERFYERELHGAVGLQRVEVNAFGRVVRVLEEQPSIPGRDLHLSLDLRLQREAMAAFGEENGALVAIDPRDGSILAMVSKPGFDPNPFVEGISRAAFHALQQSPYNPLFNRALRGRYPPGSTTKPFVGLLGLESETITPRQRIFCPGFYRLPNHQHRYRDWKRSGHGWMDLLDAVAQSCDVYFYALAHELGVERMHDYLSKFGFGSPLGVDISGELSGLLPSPQWKRANRNAPWYPGETLIMGIGQGYFLTTPLELASATAALVQDGTHYRPHVVAAIGDHLTGEVTALEPVLLSQVPIGNRLHWQHTIDTMIEVVEGQRGTARRIRNPHYRIGGKTGTSQVFTVGQDEEYDAESIPKRLRDHALFIAFAPAEEPTIALAVIVENGGHGGAVAAPIARQVLDRYLLEE